MTTWFGLIDNYCVDVMTNYSCQITNDVPIIVDDSCGGRTVEDLGTIGSGLGVEALDMCGSRGPAQNRTFYYGSESLTLALHDDDSIVRNPSGKIDNLMPTGMTGALVNGNVVQGNDIMDEVLEKQTGKLGNVPKQLCKCVANDLMQVKNGKYLPKKGKIRDENAENAYVPLVHNERTNSLENLCIADLPIAEDKLSRTTETSSKTRLKALRKEACLKKPSILKNMKKEACLKKPFIPNFGPFIEYVIAKFFCGTFGAANFTLYPPI